MRFRWWMRIGRRTSGRSAVRGIVAALVICASAPSCRRETREYQTPPVSSQRPDAVHLTSFEPGGPVRVSNQKSPYQDNAYAMSQGKQLYQQYNCVGCHAQGGGGIGPPLMDDEWIYGSAPEQIYSTIVQGRPDGMPSFGGKIPANQVWQIVAYIESLSGQTPPTASPGRDDDLAAKKPESRVDRQAPRQTGHR
jgi:cytochrome c oxidase cbb3-type subunit III